MGRSKRWPWALGAAAVLAIGLGVYAAVAPSKPAPAPVPAPTAVKAVVRDESAKPTGPAPEGMAWIPGGTFWMGSDDGRMTDAGPVHQVRVDGFFIDKTEVTNRAFEGFVRATGYVTVAERPINPDDFPGVPKERLVPGSIVFTPPEADVSFEDPLAWWRYVPGASWRHPEGPGSAIEGREDHPVVQVCWDDAVAFADWAGKRLPTEAEWEYASRGGLERKRYTWGDELLPGGRWPVNNWQGRFPRRNSADDGYERTSPVGSFPTNGFGLSDMAGNVWEWCADWYRPGYDNERNVNPTGPRSSYDPVEPQTPKRVQRGGSYLCSDLYCSRYLPGARGKGAPDTGSSHVGFRCVRSPGRPSAASE